MNIDQALKKGYLTHQVHEALRSLDLIKLEQLKLLSPKKINSQLSIGPLMKKRIMILKEYLHNNSAPIEPCLKKFCSDPQIAKKINYECLSIKNFPASMNGKSFLDAGCWEGYICKEVINRGAKRSVGIDICTCKELNSNIRSSEFEFYQLDIFSEKFLELGHFDIVHCAGVFYHVENPMSLLFRLRIVTLELLLLDTIVLNENYVFTPKLVFCRGNSSHFNISNWWVPNQLCVEVMLHEAGFEIKRIVDVDSNPRYIRLCFHVIPVNKVRTKFLPRKPEKMSIHGGSRIN